MVHRGHLLGRFNYWAEQWQVANPKGTGDLIWTVNYGLVKSQNQSDHTMRDLTECKAKLATVLTEIAEFAVAEELPHFAQEFEMAKAALESDAPERDYYNEDFVCSDIYSLSARQVIYSAGRAWVFGGMGSWNDMGFEDKETNRKYEELSAHLYDAINEGIVSAVDLD